MPGNGGKSGNGQPRNGQPRPGQPRPGQPRPGQPRPGALLGPETVSARLLGHPALMLGGPRALLLQVAHPKVAAGVVQHSGFGLDPFGRLLRTVRAMDRIAFGTPERSGRTLRQLEARHRRVTGTTPDGSPYSALDPDLLLWVHATLVDTVLAVERRYLGLLDDDQRRRFYDESRLLAAAFGVPDRLAPADLDAFGAYMRDGIASLEVGPDARAIARQVLRPPLGSVLGPPGTVAGALAAPLIEALTADLMPDGLRRAYGLRRALAPLPDWAPIGAVAAVSRTVTPRLPRFVTEGPLSRVLAGMT